eukprot:11181581-Lingulodinium_polyedra.AAC.1
MAAACDCCGNCGVGAGKRVNMPCSNNARNAAPPTTADLGCAARGHTEHKHANCSRHWLPTTLPRTPL